MKLKKQLQILINEAPNYGVSSVAMEKGVIPVLQGFAQHLKHAQYFIVTNSLGEWVLTTLRHREATDKEKTVVYAFINPQTAAQFQGISTTDVNTTAIPTTHLLFQLFSLKQVDSIIFMDRGNNLYRGTEIFREQVQISIKKQLQQLTTHQGSFELA
jgi:hypothetical protein